MEDGEEQSLEQIRDWVEASAEVRFRSQDRRELYAWVSRAEDFVFIALKRSNPGVHVSSVLLRIVGNPPLRG